MTEKWIFTGLLAFSLYIYSIYVVVVDEPFFLETKFAKHKPLEWVYVEFGPWALSGVFLFLAILLTKWAYSESKIESNVKETGESMLSTILLVIGIFILLVYLVI